MNPLKPFEIDLSGISLVEASAGTGKTYNITSLYIRALIELDLSVKNILVVTYTEAATKELKDRLLHRIRESMIVLKNGEVDDKDDQFLNELLQKVEDRGQAIDRLDNALRTFDEAAVYTIHGFCYQALQEQAFESRAMYDAEMIGDDSELVLEAVDDFWRTWVAEATDDPLKRPLLQYLKDNNLGPESLAQELGSFLGQPYLEVHPQKTPSADDIRADLKRLAGLYADMRTCWEGEQPQILSLLQADYVSGNRYPKNSLANWLDEMDDFLHSAAPPLELSKHFSKFTESTLAESLNKGKTTPPQHPFFKRADEYRAAVEPLQHYEVIFKKELLQYLQEELPEKKEDQQVLSYDDLLLRLREALFDKDRGDGLAAKMVRKYPLALVDEFQDTDPNQYDIFRKIYGDTAPSSGLFMIGDPKQSIYSFRGADVFSYLRARRDAPKEKVYGLDRNFRSAPKLLDGINKLFGDHPKPFILEDIPFKAVRPGKAPKDYNILSEKGKASAPVQFRHLPSKEKQNKKPAAERAAEDTASEINRLIEGGRRGKVVIGSDPVKAKDIAVLVRTHKQAAMINEALQQRGIKSVQYSQESVFQSEEARQLETFLKAVAEPANESLIKTALALPLTRYSAKELLDIEEDEQQWTQILDQFSGWHKKWQDKGFSAMFRSMLQEASVAKHVIGYADGERRLTNVLHLGELLQEESRKHKEGTRGVIKWLARKRKEESKQQDEEQLRLESDEELVKIVTMHRSKGLEYSIVFCPFLWYGPELKNNGNPLVYHDPNNLDKTYLDLHGKTDPDRDRKRWLVAREELAESMRLAYVAMTRAKQCCYLTWTYASKSEFSPLGYLLMNPQQVFDGMEQTISRKYRAMGSQVFEDKMQQLSEEYPKLFSMQSGSHQGDSTQLELLNVTGIPRLKARQFHRTTPMKPSYRVSSFSSLSSWMDDDPDLPDYDQFLTEGKAIDDDSEPASKKTIFTFPKGPQPGTCIHKIFEDMDFGDMDGAQTLISEQLSRYGIGEEWQDIVYGMLQTVTKASIHPQNKELRLSAIDGKKLIPELEFYYPNKDIATAELLAIIRGGNPQNYGLGQADAGFLKGYIDLTFQFDEKFYLLDYKTNYLGDAPEDYRQELLEEEMREASYDLQYHIYTIALQRFLKNRLPDYSYEQHFGGAFYLFVRGMNKQGREGIFFDRPDVSTIQQLDEYIKSGGR